MSFQEHLDRAQAAQKGLKAGVDPARGQDKTGAVLIRQGKELSIAFEIPEGFQVVKSSNIVAMRFDRSQKQEPGKLEDAVGHAELLFHSGQVWRYSYLRQKDFDALLTAESIGKHFHKHIKARVAKGELTAKLLKP